MRKTEWRSNYEKKRHKKSVKYPNFFADEAIQFNRTTQGHGLSLAMWLVEWVTFISFTRSINDERSQVDFRVCGNWPQMEVLTLNLPKSIGFWSFSVKEWFRFQHRVLFIKETDKTFWRQFTAFALVTNGIVAANLMYTLCLLRIALIIVHRDLVKRGNWIQFV